MNIRRASEADEALLRELWEEFELEVPKPPGYVPETWEEEWSDTLDDLRGGSVFLAEDDQGVVGVVRAEAPVRARTHIQLVYVRPRARREGVTKALLAACLNDARERGVANISLDVLTANEDAVAVCSTAYAGRAVMMTPMANSAVRHRTRSTCPAERWVSC